MTVRLRLAMHGARHNRVFHVVAINMRARRNAAPIETLGVFDPRLKQGETTKEVELAVDRIKYWLSVGATPSKVVTKILTLGGIIQPNSRYHVDHTYNLPKGVAQQRRSTSSSQKQTPPQRQDEAPSSSADEARS